MTRREMNDFVAQCEHVERGYCCYKNLPYEVKRDCREIGHNSGIYGWNWTLYYNPKTDTAYVDGYRNY